MIGKGGRPRAEVAAASAKLSAKLLALDREGYTRQEMAECFGLHVSTIGRRVHAAAAEEEAAKNGISKRQAQLRYRSRVRRERIVALEMELQQLRFEEGIL